MKLHIAIDENNNIPIYKQIAGAIMKDIASGKLPAGFQLPTVRQLAEEMNISKGTIKHAYESLKHMGAIEMTQGRGCFVLGKEADTSSRKEQAMAAIDNMLEELEGLGFTPREIEIYLKLKLSGLDEKYDLVKVAVVDCNPETINLIEKQLSKIEYIQVASFDLSQIVSIASKLNEEYDFVITTTTHFPEVEAVIKQPRKVAMLAMRPSNDTIIDMARVEENWKVGILCASQNFANIVRAGTENMGGWSKKALACLFGKSEKTETFLQDKDCVILPKGFEEFATAAEKELIKKYCEAGGRTILYEYIIDRGSFAYVEEISKRVLNRKRSEA
ncbi:MAG: GntR family transcriptional regulator [Firmicutes bacterium]|nr:GntR family transcriptional regulator [Bacillota bacterium]